jgi:Zn-dependent peptidase ImmA (M78 family)
LRLDYISRSVDDLKRDYGDTDPFQIAKAMGILLLFQGMGRAKSACKGFFMTQDGQQIITINSDLPKMIRKIICAHELGHAVLHSQEPGMAAFQDFALFDTASLTEHEANVFAAELLLKDEDVLELLNDDTSFFSVASMLRVPPELLDFKFRILKRKGYQFIEPPLQSDSKFLRDIEVDCHEE